MVTGTQFAVDAPVAPTTPSTAAVGARRRLRPDDGPAVTDHDPDDLPRCQRHRRAVTDHVHARAVGPPGLPAGRHPDGTGGQSDLTTVAQERSRPAANAEPMALRWAGG